MKMVFLFLLSALAALATEPMPMEFHNRYSADGSLTGIDAIGEITPGTPTAFARFAAGFLPALPVLLDSPGGDLSAALALGRAFRAQGIHTQIAPGGECDSACVFVFLGGAERTYDAAGGPLGVHCFHGAMGDVGEAAAQAGVGKIAAYLDEMGIDHHVLEVMLATPAETVTYLPYTAAAAWQLETAPPDPAEWLKRDREQHPEAAPPVATPATETETKPSPFVPEAAPAHLHLGEALAAGPAPALPESMPASPAAPEPAPDHHVAVYFALGGFGLFVLAKTRQASNPE